MEMSVPSPGSIKDRVWVFESFNLGLFRKVSFIFLYREKIAKHVLETYVHLICCHIYTLFLSFKLQTYLITAGIT